MGYIAFITQNAVRGRLDDVGLSIGGVNVVSPAGALLGNGAGITALVATNIASGSLADARLSANVPLKNAANTFSADQTLSAADILFTSGRGIRDSGANSGFERTNTVAKIYANGSVLVAELGTGALKLYVGGALQTISSFNDGLGHNVLYY